MATTPAIRLIRPNFTMVDLGSIAIWFSYETPIAFSHNGTEYVRENVWGPTTGKHLNAVNPDKSIRIPGDKFREALDKALGN